MNLHSEGKKRRSKKAKIVLENKSDLTPEMQNVISEIDGEFFENNKRDERIKMFIAKAPEVHIEKKLEEMVNTDDLATKNDVSYETINPVKKTSFSFFEPEFKNEDKVVHSTDKILGEVKNQNVTTSIDSLNEKTKNDLFDEINLRGFSIPKFTFKSKSKSIDTLEKNVSYETKTNFWFELSKGVLLGFSLFAMSLVIAKFAGKTLNPSLSEALDVKSIDSYVLINNKDVPRETPKMFKVSDLSAEIFKNPIFKDVNIGDIFLVYEKSAKIVVFRESLKKIVSVISL